MRTDNDCSFPSVLFRADPSPNPVYVLLFYDHPPISDRIRLAVTYDPWSKGESPQFVK